MNQMGGVIATLISGMLAGISWRASFLVYLMGLLCIVLCVLFLPNEKNSTQGGKKEKSVFKKYYAFVIVFDSIMFSGIIDIRYIDHKMMLFFKKKVLYNNTQNT